MDLADTQSPLLDLRPMQTLDLIYGLHPPFFNYARRHFYIVQFHTNPSPSLPTTEGRGSCKANSQFLAEVLDFCPKCGCTTVFKCDVTW